jgi:hypothetical protein
MSQGNVAANRYRRIDHLGQTETLGHGRITGHQKRKAAVRKEICSVTCSTSDCKVILKTAGMCHATNAATTTAVSFLKVNLVRDQRTVGIELLE